MHLDGKGLEEIVLYRAREVDETQGLYTLGRYGVMSNFIKGVWTPVTSLPDMEGILKGGRQFIFECKVTSQAAYDMTGGTSRSFKHQYRHLQRRAAFGALCFILLHYNARAMKTKEDPAFTVMFPVCRNKFWDDYEAGSVKSISRKEAQMYGLPVEWEIPEGKQTLCPNMYKALMALQAKEHHG